MKKLQTLPLLNSVLLSKSLSPLMNAHSWSREECPVLSAVPSAAEELLSSGPIGIGKCFTEIAKASVLGGLLLETKFHSQCQAKSREQVSLGVEGWNSNTVPENYSCELVILLRVVLGSCYLLKIYELIY